jgi:hypothetical protein
VNAHDAICKAAHDALCKIRTPHIGHVWFSPVPYFDYVADTIEAALSAAGYTITLTDDGAGSGEPVVAAGEAGSIPAGNPAPSSPQLVAEDIETTGFYYCETAGEIEAYNHGGFDVCCDKPHLHVPLTRRAWDAIGAMAADQTGEGATPAIDREAVEDIATIIEEYADDLQPPTTVEWLELRDWFKDLLHEVAAKAREIGDAS